MKNRRINHLKAIIIVHGKSEKVIFENIVRTFKLNIFIDSDKNGEKSIQINGLKKRLNNTIFKNLRSFKDKFSTVEVNNEQLNKDFKVFIVMDTDDCTEEIALKYKNKDLFKKHWLYDHIVPIFNTRDLEEVLEKTKFPFTLNGSERKREYFGIIKKYNTPDKMKEFMLGINNLLKSNLNTNMNELFDFILNLYEYN